MGHDIKLRAVKSDELNSIPMSHMIEEKKIMQNVLLISTCNAVTHTYTEIHTHVFTHTSK